MSYAFAAVWGRLKLTGYTPIQGAVGMLICSAAVSLLASCLISGQPGLRLTRNVFDAVQLLVGLGVLGTALAYLLYFRILQLAGSSNLMLVAIIVPVFAVALDAAILGQFVTGRNLLDLPLSPSGCWFWTGGWPKG